MSTSCGPSAVSNTPVKKSACGDPPLAVGAGDDELGVESEQHAGHVGGGIAVADRAADRAAMADLGIADQPRRVRDDPAVLLQDGRSWRRRGGV